MKKTYFLYLFFLLTYTFSYAQVSIKDSAIGLTIIDVGYKGFFTGGDLADRFGYTSSVGIHTSYKFVNNFYLSTGFDFLFGGKIKETGILNSITINGYLIDNEGNYTPPRMQESGFMIPFAVGKIFGGTLANNKNSGIYVEAGAQFIQHKIWFNLPRNRVPTLTKQYQKGYDRLTNGIGATQSIGYRFFANNGYANFVIALDVSENFTENRRSINLDTGLRDDKKRLDLLYGIRASWTLPIYKEAASKTYYY